MDIQPTDPPDTILILERLREQVRDVMFFSNVDITNPLWRVANALACVIDVLIDDRRKAETSAPTSSVDWRWCYEHPKEAAAEIERLQTKLEEINQLFVRISEA